MIKMRKPERHKTASWVLGINVEGRNIVEVPDGLVKDFLALGYEIVKARGRRRKDGEEVDAEA